MTLLRRRWMMPALALLLGMGALTSCEWDDDTKYTPVTQAAYFLMPTADGHQLVQWQPDGSLSSNWEAQYDISPAALTDVQVEENQLFLADAVNKRIVQVNLEDGGVTDRFFTGSLVPYRFAVGNDYLLVCDSAARKLGFLRRRNGKLTVLDVPKHPSVAAYHNLRFYIAMDGHWLSVWNEKAATEMVAYDLDHPIVEMQLDAYKGLQLVSADSTGRYRSTMDNNSTLILSQEAPLPSARERYTPWFRQLYEQEWLTNVTLRDGAVDIVAFPDSCAAFEMDFFESRTFLFSGDSLRVRHLRTGELSAAVAFEGLPLKAVVHVGDKGE